MAGRAERYQANQIVIFVKNELTTTSFGQGLAHTGCCDTLHEWLIGQQNIQQDELLVSFAPKPCLFGWCLAFIGIKLLLNLVIGFGEELDLHEENVATLLSKHNTAVMSLPSLYHCETE